MRFHDAPLSAAQTEATVRQSLVLLARVGGCHRAASAIDSLPTAILARFDALPLLNAIAAQVPPVDEPASTIDETPWLTQRQGEAVAAPGGSGGGEEEHHEREKQRERDTADDAPAQQMLLVTVPPNGRPGGHLTVKLSTGVEQLVVVPEGVGPGSQFQFALPAMAPMESPPQPTSAPVAPRQTTCAPALLHPPDSTPREAQHQHLADAALPHAHAYPMDDGMDHAPVQHAPLGGAWQSVAWQPGAFSRPPQWMAPPKKPAGKQHSRSGSSSATTTSASTNKAPANLAGKNWTAERLELDAGRVDSMLFEGAAALGWRIIEAKKGSAKKSQWLYVSPEGVLHTAKKAALEAAGGALPAKAPNVHHGKTVSRVDSESMGLAHCLQGGEGGGDVGGGKDGGDATAKQALDDDEEIQEVEAEVLDVVESEEEIQDVVVRSDMEDEIQDVDETTTTIELD